MNEITINSRTIGLNHPPFIIAELSGNHQGSLEKAMELVKLAKEAGADAIKLQTYTADTITIDVKENEFLISDPSSPWKGRNLYDLYKEAHTPWEWHKPLFKLGRELGLIVFSSPFDETAVDFLETLDVPCYKLASPEIVDLPLIKKIAATKKPLFISTGGASLIEIDEAVSTAQKSGCEKIILLKCTMAYPASPKDINLRTIPNLAETFETLVGLSDHTLGIGVAVASVAMGGCVIEKHLTKSRAEGGVDSSFSMEPLEFKALTEEAKKAWQALGEVQYGPLDAEKTSYSHRPSLYFVEDIAKNMRIERHHIRSVRPGNGLPPKEYENIIGLSTKSAIKKGTPVSWEAFNY